MSQKPPPDNSQPQPHIKVSVLWLFAFATLSITLGLALIFLGKTPSQIVAGNLLFSVFAAIVGYGVLGSSGVAKTKKYQVGGAAAIMLVFFLAMNVLVDRSETISGVLTMDDSPVSEAEIALINCQVEKKLQKINKGDYGYFTYSGVHECPNQLVFVVTISNFVPLKIIKLALSRSCGLPNGECVS
jgi:hypothetical protein